MPHLMPSCEILIDNYAKAMNDQDGISCGKGQRRVVSLVAEKHNGGGGVKLYIANLDAVDE